MRALSKPEAQTPRGPGLSPEIRLLLALSGSIACLILRDNWALGLMLTVSFIYLVKEAKLKTVLLAYTLIACLTGLGLSCLALLVQLYPPLGRGAEFMSIQAPFLRLAVTVNLLVPLAAHSSMTGLTMALNRIRLPGVIRLPLLVALRFIPVFFNDLRQIREAVKIRFRGRACVFFWLCRPALWARVMFLPLLVRLIKSTDDLALAAELKGLSTRTSFERRPFTLNRAEGWTLALAALTITLAFVQQLHHVAG